MPLLNYTTEVPASKSIAEITRMLQEAGASAIMLETGPDREIRAVSFILITPQFGRVPYNLPANVGAVILAINAQISTETAKQRKARGYKRRIPQSLWNNKDQAERIAWRITKDWLEAQLALTEIGAAQLEQIMLPFASINGRSFFDHMKERGTLALPSSTEPRPVN